MNYITNAKHRISSNTYKDILRLSSSRTLQITTICGEKKWMLNEEDAKGSKVLKAFLPFG